MVGSEEPRKDLFISLISASSRVSGREMVSGSQAFLLLRDENGEAAVVGNDQHGNHASRGS
jgi:hypothetical protein